MDDERRELATVHRLPLEEVEVVEGEIVSDEEYQRQQAARRLQGYRHDVIVVGQAVRTAATSTPAKAAARNLLYIPIGAHVVLRRWWESHTNSREERMMRAHEVAGNLEGVAEWHTRSEQAKKARHQRRMNWVELPAKLVKSALYGLGGTAGGLLLLGVVLAIADGELARVVGPVSAFIDFVSLVTWAITVAWLPVLMVIPLILLGVLWSIGRGHATASTGWVSRLQSETPDTGVVVTADTVVLALQHLRISEIKKAIKDGWIPAFTQPPVRDGRGYWTVVGLPLGVTAEMVADQRKVLARNLHRAEIETWPSDAEKAGTGPAGALDLWIADRGALSKPAPEYPLLHEGAGDVFVGVPAGVSPRGDAITVPVVANNFVAGGQMGQGKSNALRVLFLGCALDPLAQLDAFVFANNGDFDAYAPRLANYHKGVDDDIAYAAVKRLHWLYGEVARREERLAELGAKKVTRSLAEKHPDLRPIVSLFSECHELFGHPDVGEEAAEVACKTVKRARKVAIVEMFDTQSSRKEAIPPKLVELVSVNACFYVKTWRSNDGFLGDGSFQAGIRATELRPGRDRGTSLITGVSDANFELLKWYFVAVDDDTGFDAATEVIARAVANVAPGTRTAATVPAPEPTEPATRDLFEDLDEVLGHERVRLSDLPALLRDHAPDWPPYRALKGVDLRTRLQEYGVRVTNTANVPRLDPADLRSVLTERRHK